MACAANNERLVQPDHVHGSPGMLRVRSEAARNGRQMVPKQAYAQLRVAAAVALRSLHRAAPRAHDDDEDAAPAKRQKARC